MRSWFKKFDIKIPNQDMNEKQCIIGENSFCLNFIISYFCPDFKIFIISFLLSVYNFEGLQFDHTVSVVGIPQGDSGFVVLNLDYTCALLMSIN